VILQPKGVLCRRYILSSVPYVWSIPWEVNWGFMYRIVYGTGSTLRSTPRPRPLTVTSRLWKNQVLSSWLKISEATKQIKGKLRRDCEDLGALALRVGAAWYSDLWSTIDSFIKGRTNLRVEYNEGQSVLAFRLLSNNLSLPERSFAIEPVYYVSWDFAVLYMISRSSTYSHSPFVLISSFPPWRNFLKRANFCTNFSPLKRKLE